MPESFRSTITNTPAVQGKGNIITGEESDKELLGKFEAWFEQSGDLFRKRLTWSDRNNKQYLGKHIKAPFKRPAHKSNTVHNKQFENIETIVPILTEDLPEPLAVVQTDDPEVLQAGRTVENAIKYLGRIDDLLIKSESIVRDMLVKRDAVITPIWDPTIGPKGDITTEILGIENFRIDPNATWDRQGDYFFKVMPRSFRWIVEQYPKEREFLLKSFGAGDLRIDTEDGALHQEQKKQLENIIVVKEVWYWRQEKNGEYHIYRSVYVKNKILETTRNPYWDFEGELDAELEAQMIQQIEQEAENILLQEGRKMKEEEVKAIQEEFKARRHFNNFLKQEEFPYIVFPTFISHDSPWSSTSLIEQVTPLQTSLNKRKQQIDENANLMANGQWIADKDCGIDDHLFNNAPGAVYKKNPGSTMRREPGVPLPAYIFNDLQDSEIAIDNVFGANDISKGQVTAARTATEAVLLKQADRGRVALLSRHFKRSMSKLYQWQVHLMKLFYDDPRKVVLFDAMGGLKAVETISRDQIPDDMQIFVKADTARPKSQEVRRAQAIEQFQTGALDPITMFEQTGDYSNPVEKAEMLWKWQTNQLFQPEAASIEEQANQENEAILAGQDVPPNPEATETHIQIHQDRLADQTQPIPDKEQDALEEHMQLEMEGLQARNAQQQQGPQAALPPDLQTLAAQTQQTPEELAGVAEGLGEEFEGEIRALSASGLKQGEIIPERTEF